jgi:stachyose synthetase
MTGRLYRFDERDKFKKYESGLSLGPNSPPFNPKTIKELITKGIEHEHLGKQRDKAVQSKSSDLAEIESKTKKVIKESIMICSRAWIIHFK